MAIAFARPLLSTYSRLLAVRRLPTVTAVTTAPAPVRLPVPHPAAAPVPVAIPRPSIAPIVVRPLEPAPAPTVPDILSGGVTSGVPGRCGSDGNRCGAAPTPAPAAPAPSFTLAPAPTAPAPAPAAPRLPAVPEMPSDTRRTVGLVVGGLLVAALLIAAAYYRPRSR